MKTYCVGIIGYGGFGKFLHHCWDKLEGVKVIAVSDMGLSDLQLKNWKTYRNWEDLIANDEIDIVSVATPPAFHEEIACAAMRKNKHVLLEKPIALTNEGAERILKTQKETGKVMVVDHMLRYNPIIEAFVALSRKGTLGKLRHVVVSNYAQDSALPPAHWFWNKALSGGILIEHGVHFFDIVNALTSQKFKKVFGCSHNRNERQEDQVSALVLYDEGLIASHYHSFSGPGFFEQTTIRLSYDLAKVEIEGWIPMKGKIQALINDSAKEQLTLIPGISIAEIKAMENVRDVSRPEGWGDVDTEMVTTTYFGGIPYDVTEMMSATFEIQQSKAYVYGECLQAILVDLMAKIENNNHKLKVTAEDAYESLKIAILAAS